MLALCGVVMPGPSETAPIRVEEGEIDLEVVFDPGSRELELEVASDGSGPSMKPDDVVLVVGEAARTILPQDFPPLGNAGDTLWIVPQSPNPDLIYVGIAGDEVDPGAFEGPVELRLVAWSGPGDFLLWQSRGPGEFDVRMNTRDGVEDDVVDVPPGGHAHYNWGFTTNGLYRLTFVAGGIESDTGESIRSADVVVTFAVGSVPAGVDRPRLRIERRQNETLALVLEGMSGARYAVLEAETANGPWRHLADVRIEPGAAEAEVAIPRETRTARFFRAQAQ